MGTLSASLSDGPRALGPLADRGAFDQYASYRPGQVVVDDGVVYLNIAALGAAPVLEDTFDRRDQEGWGQSSHGEVWQTSASYRGDVRSFLTGARGVLARDGDNNVPDGQLLGPSQVRTNAELLVRLTLPVSEAGDNVLQLGLDTTEDQQSCAYARVTVHNDGTTAVAVRGVLDGSDEANSADEDGPSVTDGQDCWLRLRRVARAYTATLWPVGTSEPATPQVSATFGDDQPAGHPYLWNNGGVAGALFALGYLSVRVPTAATAPADDTDHWVALADALQVAPPL